MSTNSERRKEYKKKWAVENKEKVRLSQEKWLNNNQEKRKEIVKRYKDNNKEKSQKYIIDNYEWYIFNSARSRARIHNIEFSLTLEDIIIPKICPYLQVEITRIQGKGRQDYNPSLDRIDPTKGYIKGNVEIISDKANRMKNNATKEELIIFAENILKYRGIN